MALRDVSNRSITLLRVKMILSMNLALLSTLLLLAQPTFGRDFSSGDLAGYGSSNHRLRLLRERKHKTKKSAKAEEKAIAADIETFFQAEIEESVKADGDDQGQTEMDTDGLSRKKVDV